MDCTAAEVGPLSDLRVSDCPSAWIAMGTVSIPCWSLLQEGVEQIGGDEHGWRDSIHPIVHDLPVAMAARRPTGA